jgi:hypothetical protein
MTMQEREAMERAADEVWRAAAAVLSAGKEQER